MKNKAIAAVSGVKNSGKTTLMEKLIRVLTGRGLQVAAVSTTATTLRRTCPGTDSWRFGQAGACGYAIYSPWRYQLVRQTQGVCERDFFQAFPEADVILLEGFKDSPYPKIEVVRPETPPPRCATLARCWQWPPTCLCRWTGFRCWGWTMWRLLRI